jgi:hypothetical protein
MTRSRKIKIAVAAAVAAIPAVYLLTMVGSSRNALDRSLWDMGFYPLKPPSTLVGPGSIYHVTRDGKYYVTVCKADQADITPLIERSPSEEMVARELQKGSYSLSADGVKSINARLDGDVFESAHYTLSSVSVLEISLANNRAIATRLQENKDCDEAINELLKNREFVCQGQAVLLASAEYRLTSKAGGGGKVELTPDKVATVKAALEANVSSKVQFDRGRFTSGTSLYYGVKVNPTCMASKDARVLPTLPRNAFDRFINFIELDVLGW